MVVQPQIDATSAATTVPHAQRNASRIRTAHTIDAVGAAGKGECGAGGGTARRSDDGTWQTTHASVVAEHTSAVATSRVNEAAEVERAVLLLGATCFAHLHTVSLA